MTITRYSADFLQVTNANTYQTLYTVPAGKMWKIKFNNRLKSVGLNPSYEYSMDTNTIIDFSGSYTTTSNPLYSPRRRGTYVATSSTSLFISLCFGSHIISTSLSGSSSKDTYTVRVGETEDSYVFVHRPSDTASSLALEYNTSTLLNSLSSRSDLFTNVDKDHFYLYEGEKIMVYSDTTTGTCFGYDFTVFEEDIA